MTITEGYAPLPKTDFNEPDDLLESESRSSAVDETSAHEESAAEGGKLRRTRNPRVSTKVSARAVRAILSKHAEIASARHEDITLLAAVLGAKDNVDDLVAHIISTPRLTLAGTVELDAIVKAAAADPFDAVAVAMSYEAQSKSIWSILTALGLLDGPRPSKDGDASVAIARAAGKFTDEHAVRLDAVKDLARKGN